ncbi:MAG: metallophosphoesterase [Candidatus Faecousia sp.]|nr:metallophosphoesterase [Clostridiales bacterium]MDD7651658.1 metallophosphoesterase [Bacillota bacterium]MDY4219241.1 metallophosphoesterase [Candidatus Faecousia sp.]
MKFLILSDSHDRIEPMLEAVNRERPQGIVHLGDYWADGKELGRLCPGIPLYQVAGNCDRYSWAPEQTDAMTVNLGGVLCFLTHGHRQGVKQGLYRLYCAALEAGARVALFGHTHQSFCQEENGIWLLNPGSCGSWHGTYGILEISNGSVSCEIRPLLQE